VNAALHPLLEPVAGWLGAWSGSGTGEYPTINPFGYAETFTLGHAGKPLMAYSQRTTAADDGRALHAESGYWRMVDHGRCELVIAHGSGHVEVATGTWESHRLEVRSVGVIGAPSSKSVVEISRVFVRDAETISYDLAMAAVDQPLLPHLHAELHRA
jgi:hypothetical protein